MSYSSFYARFYNMRQKIGLAFKLIWRTKVNRLYLFIILFLQLLVWFQAVFIYRNLSGNILVLHYNVDFGVDLVADPSRIFYYPLLGFGVSLANLIILLFLRSERDKQIFAHLLFGTAVLFGVFLSLALMSVYLINFR